jgi:hypothetical protein
MSALAEAFSLEPALLPSYTIHRISLRTWLSGQSAGIPHCRRHALGPHSVRHAFAHVLPRARLKTYN